MQPVAHRRHDISMPFGENLNHFYLGEKEFGVV